MNPSGGRNCSSNKARLEELFRFRGFQGKTDFDTTGEFLEAQCFYKYYCVQRVGVRLGGEMKHVVVGLGLGTTKPEAKQAASFITLKTLGFKTIDITT